MQRDLLKEENASEENSGDRREEEASGQARSAQLHQQDEGGERAPLDHFRAEASSAPQQQDDGRAQPNLRLLNEEGAPRPLGLRGAPSPF